MNKEFPDLVTFGESMVLLMPGEQRTLEHAASVDIGFGGAESNTAIGLARLGCHAGWFGALGDDPFGRRIQKALRGEGVDVSRSVLSKEAPTGMMLREEEAGRLAVHYYRRGSAASRMSPENLDDAYIKGARMLHVTGITMAISQEARASVIRAMEIAREAGVKISFDPNIRLKLWTEEEARGPLLQAAAMADYFLPGWNELKMIYNTDDEEFLISQLHELDAVTVIKDKGGASAIVENGSIESIPFYTAERVVDTVGAGDAFNAGFLAGLLKGMDTTGAVRLASICGSLAVQGRGDWEPQLTWGAVQQRLDNSVWVER